MGGHPFWFGRELNIFAGTVVARCVKWLPRGEEGGGFKRGVSNMANEDGEWFGILQVILTQKSVLSTNI